MAELRTPLRFDAGNGHGVRPARGDIEKGDFDRFSEQQESAYASHREFDSKIVSRIRYSLERILGMRRG